jgi:ubiquinone/menaquinone biosynthesis C-methylase UbiE
MLLAHLEATQGARVLDIGSGLGGPARDVALRYGATVDGVDLTPEFVDAATELSRRVGLGGVTRFVVGSATALPAEDGVYDMALLMHVGMNVADKTVLMAEARRALKRGALFGVFDVMQGPNAEPLAFPLPWAAAPGMSFVAPPEVYREAAETAGFELVSETDRSAFALDFFARKRAEIEQTGVPPLGIHLMMGPTAGEKIENYVANVATGRAAPTEMIFLAA